MVCRNIIIGICTEHQQTEICGDTGKSIGISSLEFIENTKNRDLWRDRKVYRNIITRIYTKHQQTKIFGETGKSMGISSMEFIQNYNN